MSQITLLKQSTICKQRKGTKVMGKSLAAEATLKRLIKIILSNLEELKHIHDIPEQAFLYGEKVAYIECLELIQGWEKAGELGVDFDIERFFKL